MKLNVSHFLALLKYDLDVQQAEAGLLSKFILLMTLKFAKSQSIIARVSTLDPL